MLDKEQIEELKKFLSVKPHSISEIKVALDLEDINSTKLVNYLKTLDNVNIINDTKPHLYETMKAYEFTGKIIKDKNILKFETKSGEFAEYDFNKHSFITIVRPNYKSNYPTNNLIFQIFSYNGYNSDITNLKEYEWLFSYIDLLDEDIDSYFNFTYSTCPNGYVKWLRETNQKINTETIKLYQSLKKYPHIPIPILKEQSSNRWYRGEDTRFIYYDYLWEKCNLPKIINNSIKKYEFAIKDYISNLLDIIQQLDKKKIEWKSVIDNNRTLIENVNNLNIVYEEMKNKHLSQNLQKLNFINNLEIENYVVIVPQNAKDLVNEGKQQNNCVGHYYNDSINQGRNLIYFIRYKDNPQKSLVTCRYNISNRRTVEHRIKNNNSTTPNQDKIIEIIDNIIRENFDNYNYDREVESVNLDY
jgi:hypothetical protein